MHNRRLLYEIFSFDSEHIYSGQNAAYSRVITYTAFLIIKNGGNLGLSLGDKLINGRICPFIELYVAIYKEMKELALIMVLSCVKWEKKTRVYSMYAYLLAKELRIVKKDELIVLMIRNQAYSQWET